MQRNAYFLHQENILYAMINDESATIRKLGWRKILKVRNASDVMGLRVFEIPNINFEATSYHEAISWNDSKVTVPPLLPDLSIKTISNHCEEPPSEFDMPPRLPCHTQAVERHIKLLTEAAGRVSGSDQRDGYIRNVLKSRSDMPEFRSKKDFV